MREILEKKVNEKGKKQVAKELGVSQTTLILYLQGKYPAQEKIEERIRKIYNGEGIQCPVLNVVTPAECANHYSQAVKVGRMVSNPDKLRLYRSCLKCHIRK